MALLNSYRDSLIGSKSGRSNGFSRVSNLCPAVLNHRHDCNTSLASLIAYIGLRLLYSLIDGLIFFLKDFKYDTDSYCV